MVVTLATLAMRFQGVGMSLDQYAKDAEAGRLALRLSLEEFDNVINACDAYMDGLRDLNNDAENLSHRRLGFSEDKLTQSGATLARKFQEKAAGGDHSAASTFQSHIERVEDMKSLFVAFRKAAISTDEGVARNLKALGS